MSKTITREQYVQACVTFWEALGGNAGEVYFPVHLDEDKITFSRTPAANGGHVRATAGGFDADPAEFMRECLGWSEEADQASPPALEVLSIVTTVKVVG